MADQKQKEIKAKHFWLNPSVKVDGVYKVHVNIEDTQGRLKYNERPPHRLTLAEKIVYVPELITDDEKKSLAPEYPLTNPKNTKQLSNRQTDRFPALTVNIKAAERQIRDILRIHGDWERRKNEANEIIQYAGLIKKQNTEYLYIGNSEPVAMGISAYFFKKNPHDDSPTSSLLSMLQRGERIAIDSFFNEYNENQIATEKKLNEAKTIAQGRLTPEQLEDTFNRDHLESEQEYYKESEGFFNMIHCEDEHKAKILREYVEGYLAWVADQLSSEPLNHDAKKPQQGYNTEYDPEQLFMIHKQIIEKEFLTESFMKAQDFVDVFSGAIIESHMPYNGSKKKLGSIIFLLTGKRPIPSEVNKIFLFHEKGSFDSDDFPKKIHAGLQSIIDSV